MGRKLPLTTVRYRVRQFHEFRDQQTAVRVGRLRAKNGWQVSGQADICRTSKMARMRDKNEPNAV